MTQGIALYSQANNQLIYFTTHRRNGDYLEREADAGRFEMLAGVDDCDPSYFYTTENLSQLIRELDIIIGEAEKNLDTEISNHLKEILVLCRLCLWNFGDFVLVISPFETVSEDNIPKTIPNKFLLNISLVGT